MKAILFMCWVMPAMLFAQIKSLKIGDRFVTADLFEAINFKTPKLDLKTFSNDLLVLDYFTTTCGTCIAAMPKNNALVKQFKGRLMVIPVTFEKRDAVVRFMKGNSFTKSNLLPVIVEDNALRHIFPHKGVPHMVWIYQGKVIAITAGDMLNEQNVNKVLGNEDVKGWPVKNDYFDQVSVKIDTAIGLYSKLSGYVNGAKLKYEKDTIGNVVRFKMTNVPLVPALLYLFAQNRVLPMMKKERIVLNVKNRNDFQQTDSLPKSFWSQEHAFCYESTWSLKVPEKTMIHQLVNDLSNRLGVRTEMNRHVAKVWIVKPGNKSADVTLKSAEKQTLKIWMMAFEIFNPKHPPIIMEGVDEATQVVIHEVKNFQTFKEELEKNGLTLEEGTREIEALIINEY